MIYRVVYVSSAMELFPDKELAELLEKSRIKNHSVKITGMLLYKDGNFMQILEGPKEAVLKTMDVIRSDTRHRGLIVLLEEEHSDREFGEWAMGFKKLDATTRTEIPGYSDFFELPLSSDQFQNTPSRALKLLLSFRKIMR